jgi:hypothetical protein
MSNNVYRANNVQIDAPLLIQYLIQYLKPYTICRERIPTGGDSAPPLNYFSGDDGAVAADWTEIKLPQIT